MQRATEADYQRLIDDDSDITWVHVEQWGFDVCLQRLGVSDWYYFVGKLQEIDTDEEGNFANTAQMIEIGVELVARSVVDEAGNLPFDNVKGRRRLQTQPFALVTLMNAAMELSGLGEGDFSEQLRAAKKNYQTPGGRSHLN